MYNNNCHHHFVLILAHNWTIPIATALHIVDFGPIHKSKPMVQVCLNQARLKFRVKRPL